MPRSHYIYAAIVDQFLVAIVQAIDPNGKTGYGWVLVDRDRDSQHDGQFYATQAEALIAAQAKLAQEQAWYAGFDAFMAGESMPETVLEPHWVQGWQAAKRHVGFNLLQSHLPPIE